MDLRTSNEIEYSVNEIADEGLSPLLRTEIFYRGLFIKEHTYGKRIAVAIGY